MMEMGLRRRSGALFPPLPAPILSPSNPTSPAAALSHLHIFLCTGPGLSIDHPHCLHQLSSHCAASKVPSQHLSMDSFAPPSSHAPQ